MKWAFFPEGENIEGVRGLKRLKGHSQKVAEPWLALRSRLYLHLPHHFQEASTELGTGLSLGQCLHVYLRVS